MQQAMDTVIRELGSDAVILNSKKVRKKGIQNLFRKPVLEVMVAYDPAKVPPSKKAGGYGYGGYQGVGRGGAEVKADREKEADKGQLSFSEHKFEDAGPAKPHQDRAVQINNEQLINLDSRISSLDSILNNFINKFSFVKRDITYDYSKEVEDLFCRLIENQVREELAHKIAKETESILKKQPGTNAVEVMEHLIFEQIGVPEPIRPKKFQQKIILMIGPTGVGKTTSLVKLAADFAIKQKKRVGLINTDTYRIAAQQQLKTYADILSIPLSIVYQDAELTEAIQSMSDREVIFIDTAGKRPGDEQHREDILKIIELARPEDILLCVSAPTSFASLKEIIDTYDFVGDYKFIVTKLDETRHRGMILNLVWYSQKKLAYYTIGQNVPDDIQIADRETVTDQMLRN
jgi:flagellar biosynthesis protein FlhF